MQWLITSIFVIVILILYASVWRNDIKGSISIGIGSKAPEIPNDRPPISESILERCRGRTVALGICYKCLDHQISDQMYGGGFIGGQWMCKECYEDVNEYSSNLEKLKREYIFEKVL